MVDLELLKKRGYSEEKYKSLFTSEVPAEKIKKLKDLISSREKEGVQRSLKSSRLYWAIDRAYDAPFRQVSYTLVEGLLAKKLDDTRILQAVKDWGLAHLLVPVRDKTTGKICCYPNGTEMQKLHLPTFFQILVPLVQSYLKIRWGKLFTDLNQSPLHKFDPLKLTSENLLKCEIITDRIQMMVTQMGHAADLRQTIFQTLLYGFCLKFPMEDWYKEVQTVLNKNGKEEEFTVREGLRFAIPHPSRTFWDLAHRPDTINTDTGCEFGGYWDVMRFGDLENNPAFWNKDKVAYSGSTWFSDLWNPYTELYPCALMFPSEVNSGGTQRDASMSYYGASERDKAVLMCSSMMKIKPKEFGLFDYDGYVWHRFMVAAGETVIHCVPLAYNPMVYYGYDADGNRELNSSLGLELLPYQDHLGNLLSQYVYSVKKNLASATFYNTDILSDEEISKIDAVGEELYRGLTFIPKSKTELNWQKTGVQEAFYNVSFPRHDTASIAQALSSMIGILERLLGFSSQEIGQPAAHEQTAAEISTIHANQSIRLSFTNSFIEDGLYAEKKMDYEATMAYSADEIFAGITGLNDIKKSQLEKMGFKIEEEPSDQHSKAGVSGNKNALRLEGFSRGTAGLERLNNSQVAIGMLQTFQVILSQPQLVATLGMPQIIDLFNRVMTYSGFDKDFRLKAVAEAVPPQEQENQMQQQLQQMMVKVAETVSSKVVNDNLTKMADVMKEKVIQPIEEAIGQITQKLQSSDQHDQLQDQAIGKLTEKIAQLYQAAAQAAPPVQPQPQFMAPNVIPQPSPNFPG